MYELTNDDGSKWLAVYIKDLKEYLSKYIERGHGFVNVAGLKSNIAYNLQYLMFNKKLQTDIAHTSVLRKTHIKMFIVVGCSIIESICNYALKREGHFKESKYEKEQEFIANEKEVNGNKYRLETTVYKVLKKPKYDEMNFDSMVKSAESKDIFKVKSDTFAKLNHLRKLRNRIHLQGIKDDRDTDYNKFNDRHQKDMEIVLKEILTCHLFKPTKEEEEKYFKFLS